MPRAVAVVSLVALVLFSDVGAATDARAGTYDVVACNSAPGYVNNAWSLVRSGASSGRVQCPAGAGIEAQAIAGSPCPETAAAAGLASTDAFSPLTASSCRDRWAPGGTAKWVFTAPSGTTLQSFAGTWRCYASHYTRTSWWLSSPHGGSGSGTCSSSSFTAVSRTFNAGATTLELGVLFPTCLITEPGCSGHYLRAALAESRTTIRDDNAPTLTVTGGSIPSAGWHRQAADIRFDAADNVGIRVAKLTVDGGEVARRDFACDFTRPVPCANQYGQVLSVDTSGLSEGNHSARLTVVDSAGNQSNYDRTLRVDRGAPELVLNGTLKPEGHSWVGLGDQDLAIDAIDTGSGAVKVTWQVFGTPGSQEQTCPQGGCDLFADVLTDTSLQAEGAHTLTVTATDAAGNTSTQSWMVKLERTPPTLSLSGSLKAAAGQTLGPGQTYTLTAGATDSVGGAPQAGLGRLEFAVDDQAPTVIEQPCPTGACAFSHVFSFVVDEYDEGDHTITVTATDGAGNETTQSFQVTTGRVHDDDDDGEDDDEDELECERPPAPAVSSPTISSVNPQTALESFRAKLPQAFDQWTRVDFSGAAVQPKLDASVAAEFEATGSVAPMTVDKQVSDGVTANVQTDDTPICATPRIVSASASAPTAVINETTTLYANSSAATDTLFRPSVGGTGILQQIRQSVAPQAFSWHVELEPGQELKQLSDGSVAVVEPVPPDSPIVPSGLEPPPVPSISARKEALRDTRTHVSQAIDAFDRALETTPDEIVALLPKPWAVDSLDRPVETSLAASGSTVTMQVAHSATSGAYPVITGLDLVVGDALDEWVAMEADAQTADYTEADFVAQPGLSQTLPPPPQDDIPDEEFEFDPSSIDDPSAFEDQDLAAGADENEEVPSAEASAAPRGAFTAELGLTGSHPAVLYSKDRGGLGSRSVRPIVPWRVTEILAGRARGNPDQRAAQRKRAFLWDSFKGAQPTGYVRIAESGSHGEKTAAERTNGVTTDVALQFVQARGRRNGQRFEYVERRAPRVWEYRRVLTKFLMDYKSVLLDAQGAPTGNLTPWNEPQLRDNPTRQLPVRAARYWAVANALCHPRPGPHLCADVIAGEYSGTRHDQTIQRTYRTRSGGRIVRTRNYQRIYHDYLFGRLVLDYPRNTAGERRQRPRVWGFHNYDDANRYQRALRGSSRWPITKRYHRRFSSDGYRRRDGSLPRMWVTATGVFYHRGCGDNTQSKLYRENCAVPGGTDKSDVLFGMRSQADTLAAMLRELVKLKERFPGPGVDRLQYYTLHDTRNASAYGGPSGVLGRRPQAYDSGLIGSGGARAADGTCFPEGDGCAEQNPQSWYENRTGDVARFRGARGFSRSLQPRLAFCVLRDRVLRRGRPGRCSR